MRRIIIIEDEPISAMRLVRLVKEIEPDAVVEPTLETVNDIVERLRSDEPYSLILADIRVGGGDVFDAFRQAPPQSFVIFTTAYDNYAMNAIKSNGIDYLLKPIDKNELRAALAKTSMSDHKEDDICGRVAALVNCTKYWRKRIVICKGDEYEPVNVEDVNFFVLEGDKTLVHLKTGVERHIRQTMNEIESQLNPDEFFRVNRQYIVNIRAVKNIKPYIASRYIVSIEGCKDNRVTISRAKAPAFRSWIDK